MSSTDSRRWLAAAACLSLLGSPGCWEQVSRDWFPQMKRQLAVQAYEEVTVVEGQVQGFSPPEGTVPVDWADNPDVANLPVAQQEALANPVAADLGSLKRGEELYGRYCITCHGVDGGGNGPVAGPPFGQGPFGLVLPIGGPMSVAKTLTDGHIYTTISVGRGRMPAYRRITPEDRWHVINYLRELNGQGGRQ
ncbi:MAG: c-type cytochrome [Myxococcota bacterium]